MIVTFPEKVKSFAEDVERHRLPKLTAVLQFDRFATFGGLIGRNSDRQCLEAILVG